MKTHRVLLAAALGFCALGYPPTPLSTPLPSPPRPKLATRAAPLSAAAAARPPYRTDRVLVRPAPGADLAALARRHHSAVLRPIGPAGLATLAVPVGESADTFLADLRTDAALDGALRSGATYGASDAEHAAPLRASTLQWHLNAARIPPIDRARLRGITIAVLDTGVAYETAHTDAGDTVAAPSLAGAAITAPWDFVNGDAHATDDHQHGTHVASLIASAGALSGVAPGVGLMPVKILDADNTGDEQALLDGLAWALDHGADVINLSLSFGDGYLPSAPLQDLLADADAAGVIVVAAAGNSGAPVLSWPAEARTVISVGACALNANGQIVPAAYSDTSPGMDLLAPGGDLDDDFTGDGYGDGLLAETINPGDPAHTGYWFYEGTSQAAAVVSGAVAQLLAVGVPAARVRTLLQATATPLGAESWASGWGAGALNLAAARDNTANASAPADAHAALLPYLLRDDTGLRIPVARVDVRDASGAVWTDGTVWAQVRSGDGSARTVSCTLGDDGTCLLVSPPELAVSDADAEQAWLFTVGALVTDGISVRPGGMLPTSPAFAELAASLQDDPDLAGASPGVTWQDDEISGLGPVGAALSVLDLNAGPVAPPEALLLTSALADTLFQPTDLEIDGSGLSTDALGLTAPTAHVGGSGLATDALGLHDGSIPIVTLQGSGLATDALGLTSTTTKP